MTRNNFADGSPFSAEGLDSVVNAVNHEAILSGGAPSVGTGNYEVDLTACDYVVDDTDLSISADTVTLSSASASDRVDIITADKSPGFNVTEGSPGTNPNAPTIPTNEVLICAVFVDSGSTSLVTSDIYDYRVLLERDATTYKGADLDSDGDGQVDSADDSDALGGTPAAEYNTFDVSTFNFQPGASSSSSTDTGIANSNVLAVHLRNIGATTLPKTIGLDGAGSDELEWSMRVLSGGNLELTGYNNTSDNDLNFDLVVLHQ